MQLPQPVFSHSENLTQPTVHVGAYEAAAPVHVDAYDAVEAVVPVHVDAYEAVEADHQAAYYGGGAGQAGGVCPGAATSQHQDTPLNKTITREKQNYNKRKTKL